MISAGGLSDGAGARGGIVFHPELTDCSCTFCAVYSVKDFLTFKCLQTLTGVILLINQAVNKLYVVLWVVIAGNNRTITLQLNMKRHSQHDHLHRMASLAHSCDH